MLNLPMDSFLAMSKATPVVLKHLPWAAFLVHWLSPVRYSRLSSFSIKMFMNRHTTAFLRITRIQSEIIFCPSGVRCGNDGFDLFHRNRTSRSFLVSVMGFVREHPCFGATGA